MFVFIDQLLFHEPILPSYSRTSIHYALPHPQILYLCEAVLRRHRWRESKASSWAAWCPFDRILQLFQSVNRLFSDSEQLLKLAAASLLPAGSFLPPPMVVFNSKATSRLTSTLVQAIQSSDLSFLYSILFPSPSSFPSPVHPISSPLLVNCPDAKGWSAIHHCVSATRPSVDVLDALYCAGSDVSLFTATEHYTPLHCLARSARAPDNENASALYQFTIHLIRDFRAPLSARDTDDETCIHIAAEHGESIDVLIAFLDCDPTGFVRKMRNSRGYVTCISNKNGSFIVGY